MAGAQALLNTLFNIPGIILFEPGAPVLFIFASKPSALEDKDNPDWVPSVNLGYGSSSIDCSRYKRRMKRKVCSLAEDLAESGAADNNDTESNHKDVGVQTDVSMKDLDLQQQVFRDMQLELSKVKDNLKKITLNEDSFKDNDDKVKYFTGLPTYALLLIIFDVVQHHLKETPQSALSKFQKLLLTLMHLRLNFDFTDLAYRFGVSKSTSSRAFEDCLYVMHKRFSRMVSWPERSDLVEKVPSSFLDAFGKKATIIIDCFEIKIEKPSNVVAAAQSYSHYKSSNTAKYLIGISPQGNGFCIYYMSFSHVNFDFNKSSSLFKLNKCLL
ncbi:uncharacterized protein LOC129230193 [Uloborus diversus]|uniref:uncharacterized protein LOC129230193 n=1 Tax=Uloborus diversus TaxID=327109 RepID=UPI00240A3BB3|nr:uncharacterized protein LOC129230193 [Uloborus diversus]